MLFRPLSLISLEGGHLKLDLQNEEEIPQAPAPLMEHRFERSGSQCYLILEEADNWKAAEGIIGMAL